MTQKLINNIIAALILVRLIEMVAFTSVAPDFVSICSRSLLNHLVNICFYLEDVFFFLLKKNFSHKTIFQKKVLHTNWYALKMENGEHLKMENGMV